MSIKKVAIIGGGAAGFFAAANLIELCPSLEITIYEASKKMMSKVLISGGGRCNVTNQVTEPAKLAAKYPRGKDFLIPLFHRFSSADTRQWFENRNIPLKTEEDGRVFPVSDSSQSIYNCLYRAATSHGVTVQREHRLRSISYQSGGWDLEFNTGSQRADAVLLATGSNKQIYQLLGMMDIATVAPVPSLFTFNAKVHNQEMLSGLSVPNAQTQLLGIAGAVESGPLLITHWGYSAPAILKLSAWYARELEAMDYTFTLRINWGFFSKKELEKELRQKMIEDPKSKVAHWKDHGLPKRLWQALFIETGINEYTNWSEIGKKGIKKLVDILCHYDVEIEGKSTFKEEFVTAGGIALEEVDGEQMSISCFENLYAAGEVLNIDAITGGFNFQAAWTTAYIAAHSISLKV